MEPAAPGTEDDIKLNVQTNVSKKESEQERLLSITARLPSGKVGSVFELSFCNGSEHWYCNLCECPIMGRVYHHEIGKRHTNNMQMAGNHHLSIESEIESEPALQIAPGEPVPPGFEGEVAKVAQIQERLDSFTVGPLIGLEYLFELQEYDREKEPSYLCLLCDKRGDPRTVIAHLASYNHIIQYTQRHFITCFRALSPYITKQYKRNWQATMQKIAEAIENKFGRLKPHVVEREAFETKRAYYQSLVATGPHFNERSGVTFEELVSKEQLTKSLDDDVTITKPSEDVAKRAYRKTGTEPGHSEDDKKTKRSPSPPVVAKPKKPKPAATAAVKRRSSLSSCSSISSSELGEFDPSQHFPQKKTKDFEPRRKYGAPWEKSPAYKRQKNRSPPRRFDRKSRSRSHSPRRGYNDRNRSRGGPLHPWQRSDYIRTRNDGSSERNKQKSDKLEEYKKLANAIENDMERILKQHEKNPEKHPQYNEEWKKFWNRRYKELQVEGKDAANYDFKPEWIEFWNKRMTELHHGEIKTKKDALRKRLGLPEEPAPICFKISGKKKSGKDDSNDSKPAPIASVPDQDPDVIVIEDKDEDTVSSKRSHSPWESEPGSRPNSRRSREKSKEKSRERSHISREKSRERNRRSHDRDRSRSRSRDRNWHARGRDDYHRDRDRDRDYPPRDKAYYRDAYRKSELPNYIKPPRVMRDVTRHPVLSPPTAHKPELPKPEEEEEDTEVNVVGVLRLLTALEEKLGSLGPKVIDLLGQALAMEKTEANSSETLLDNEVNCVLFETVKEKLKGQLLAGLVDFNQQKAFKNAIKKIASLMHYANERTKQKEKEKPKADPIKVPGVGTVDKTAIAKQIATALVLQGKTDVTQAELEQLINAVVGMAEASRASNKPMTTATFLQQLTQPKQEIKSEPPIGSLVSSLQATAESIATAANSMEGLSDSDLQTLLQNFKDLCTDEQHSLISYLKKLEAKEPERVERLRKFVNLDANSSTAEKPQEKNPTEKENNSRRSSPFSNRLAGLNPTSDDNVEKEAKSDEAFDKSDKPVVKVNLDSDDEEYSFEDVFKAAKQNVTEKEEKDRNTAKAKAKAMVFKTEDFDLSNAKSLIANIMGQFKANNESTSTSNLLNLGAGNLPKPEIPPVSLLPNFENFPINLANLASALNTAQQATSDLNRRPLLQNPTNLQQNHANVVPNQPNIGFNQPNMGMNVPNMGLNQSNIGPNQPNMGQNFRFPQKPQNPVHQGPNNYPQNISYPQQNQYMNSRPQFGGPNNFGSPNNFGRPNFEHNRYPALGNHEPNPHQFPPHRPGPGQFNNNYGNRW